MKFDDRTLRHSGMNSQKKINLIETHLHEFFVPVNPESLFEAEALFSKPTLAHEDPKSVSF